MKSYSLQKFIGVSWEPILTTIQVASRLRQYTPQKRSNFQRGTRCLKEEDDCVFQLCSYLYLNVHNRRFSVRLDKGMTLMETIVFQSPYISSYDYNETVRHLFIDFKKTYVLIRIEVLYYILIQFSIPMKLIRLIKMFLNDTQR